MARITVDFPFTQIKDPNTGRNLGLGKAYFGVIDGNPFTNPADRVNVYAVQPDGSELLVSQPIQVSAAGIAVVSGTPVQLRIDDEYSLVVVDYQDAQVYYAARVATWEAGTDARIDALEAYVNADKVYETVAAMKAATNASGALVRCKRYGPTTPVLSSLVYLSRGVGWPVTADNYINHSDAGGNFLELLADEIGPEMAGAMGDGVTVDKTPVQKAADFCATNKRNLVINSGFTFGLNDYIFVKNGCKGVIGKGGTLKYIGPNYCGVMLWGKTNGAAENVSRCQIRNLIIDCNNIPGTGIFMNNASDCIVDGNMIFGVTNGYGVLSRCWINGLSDALRNKISNNLITLYEPTSASDPLGQLVFGIALDSQIDYTPYPDAPSFWKANKFDKGATYVNAYSTVENNTVLGGYYGLQFDSVRYSNLEGNQTTRNVRGISAQHGCRSNTIAGNTIVDNTSGGIHLAYESVYNVVEANTIYSSRANQQALLNCYVGCVGNKFTGNQVIMVGASNPNWHIYCGLNNSQNEFSNNTLRGPCQKAYMMIESGWNNAVTNPASYGFGEGPDVNDFASSSTSNNIFAENKLYPTSAKPAIILSQVSDGSGNYLLERNVIQNNQIMSNTPNYQLELFEMFSGGISFTKLKDNSFDTDADQTKFVLPRGQLSFREYTGNTYINTGNFNLPANGTTPNGAIGSVIAHTDTVATSVTTYTNCNDNYDLTVRLSLNTTLVHSTGSMRLKGAANVVGAAVGGSDAFIRLRQLGGVWFEQYRNF